MTIDAGFSFQPLPPVENEVETPFPGFSGQLGPLAALPGTWTGKGFNVIWRPNHTPPGQDRFLELNLTSDSIAFTAISGPIPNRGLLQPDINLFGLTYLQQISDANLHAGLHIEPGVWLTIPATTDPKENPTVARLASIPHGTTIEAQGIAEAGGAPVIPDIDIRPFTIGNGASRIAFPEQTLATPTKFRTAGAGLTGITQAIVDNPAKVLTQAIAGQHITATTRLHIDTSDPALPGGGTSNLVFLRGTKDGPNANAVDIRATFWLETLQGQTAPTQLQYAQIVTLNFNGISWPHVTVATLKKA